jgi:hypothetical protein
VVLVSIIWFGTVGSGHPNWEAFWLFTLAPACSLSPGVLWRERRQVIQVLESEHSQLKRVRDGNVTDLDVAGAWKREQNRIATVTQHDDFDPALGVRRFKPDAVEAAPNLENSRRPGRIFCFKSHGSGRFTSLETLYRRDQLPPRRPDDCYLTSTPTRNCGEDEEVTRAESPAEADESDQPRQRAPEGAIAVDDRGDRVLLIDADRDPDDGEPSHVVCVSEDSVRPRPSRTYWRPITQLWPSSA